MQRVGPIHICTPKPRGHQHLLLMLMIVVTILLPHIFSLQQSVARVGTTDDDSKARGWDRTKGIQGQSSTEAGLCTGIEVHGDM